MSRPKIQPAERETRKMDRGNPHVTGPNSPGGEFLLQGGTKENSNGRGKKKTMLQVTARTPSKNKKRNGHKARRSHQSSSGGTNGAEPNKGKVGTRWVVSQGKGKRGKVKDASADVCMDIGRVRNKKNKREKKKRPTKTRGPFHPRRAGSPGTDLTRPDAGKTKRDTVSLSNAKRKDEGRRKNKRSRQFTLAKEEELKTRSEPS